MRHLTEEQLVGRVLEGGQVTNQSRKCLFTDVTREHLARCPECRQKYEELRELTAFLSEPRATPPVLAWSRLKARLERSRRPGRDWTEPRWLPLVLVHLAAVVIGLVLIVTLGGWLESSTLWEWIGQSGLVRTIGPRGLVGLAFVAGGGLVVLALMPVLWWESQSHGH